MRENIVASFCSGSVVTRAGSAALLFGALGLSACAGAGAPTLTPRPDPDPRIGLAPGYQDAGEAIWNLDLVSTQPKPDAFRDPSDPGSFRFANTDLAFQGTDMFVGNYHGVQIYDISNPDAPRLRGSIVCPGGQGDVSVYGDLVFMSVEETRGRLDCGDQGTGGEVDAERFRGVRIFDISDINAPQQVAAVQTCRGSHTHTLVTDPNDASNLYVYVSGTGPSRTEEELPGCRGVHWQTDPSTAYWRIEVIRVPLATPSQAEIVNMPRIFSDPQSGAVGGLWEGGAHGPGTQETAQTNQCHDITAFPEIGLAAGACSGNGILLDISDPANPVRIDEVTDPNFAYWHSATFNGDGTKVVFTDEWGGGSLARCRESDPETWGANAIFDIVDRKLQLVSYYKLPAPQSEVENCVAHNGSLIPVPGRDIMVQAWYQGGISVFDFTDSANPVEIAYFDRGPLDPNELTLGGYWSAYWYNGRIYGSEIARGIDVLRLLPSQYLSASDVAAAESVRIEDFNPQLQAFEHAP